MSIIYENELFTETEFVSSLYDEYCPAIKNIAVYDGIMHNKSHGIR